MNNGQIIYNAVKHWYITEYGKKGYFYQDYLENATGEQSFIEDLKQHEPWLDLSKEPTQYDVDMVIEHIQEGQESSGRIMIMVDGLTDKNFRDGNH